MSDRQKVDFIGTGSVKSGSTWVAKCLEEHPEVSFSAEKSRKELHFFNTSDWGGLVPGRFSRFEKGLSWYLNQIPVNSKVRGEFCVSYLPDPTAVKRIKKFFPGVKILAVLRDPVDMLYSFYCAHKPSISVEMPETFAEFMETGRTWELGLYHRHLQRYFENFPARNIHTMIFRDIKNRPPEVARDLYSFLEVDPNFAPSVLNERVNPTFNSRSEFLKTSARRLLFAVRDLGPESVYNWLVTNGALYRVYCFFNESGKRFPPLPPEMRQRFKRYYWDDINRLEVLLGRDLDFWK